MGAAIGGVLGGVLIIILFAILTVVCLKKRKFLCCIMLCILQLI